MRGISGSWIGALILNNSCGTLTNLEDNTRGTRFEK